MTPKLGLHALLGGICFRKSVAGRSEPKIFGISGTAEGRQIRNGPASAYRERRHGISGTFISAYREQNRGTSGTRRNHDSHTFKARIGLARLRNFLTQRFNILTCTGRACLWIGRATSGTNCRSVNRTTARRQLGAFQIEHQGWHQKKEDCIRGEAGLTGAASCHTGAEMATDPVLCSHRGYSRRNNVMTMTLHRARILSGWRSYA
jgi:hypothetical protein